MKLILFKNWLFYCWFHKRFDECEMIMWVQNNKSKKKLTMNCAWNKSCHSLNPFNNPLLKTFLRIDSSQFSCILTFSRCED